MNKQNPTENLPPTENTQQAAQAVAEAQSALQAWINRLLWVVIIVLGAYTFYTWRKNTELNNLENAAALLSSAEAIAFELELGAVSNQPLESFPLEKRSEFVRRAMTEAAGALDAISTLTEDPRISAAAGVVRGDLNWALAMLQPPAEATTRPSLAYVQPGQDPLDLARRYYKDVVDNYPKESISVAKARLGLAAIAENKRDWDSAKSAYEAISNDTSSEGIASFVETAKFRLSLLPQLSVKVKADLATTQPATDLAIPVTDVAPPATGAPTAQPATQP